MTDPDSIIAVAVVISTLVTVAAMGALAWFRTRATNGLLRGLFTGASVLMAAVSVAMVERIVERLNSTRGTADAIFIDPGLLKLAPIVMTLPILAYMARRRRSPS